VLVSGDERGFLVVIIGANVEEEPKGSNGGAGGDGCAVMMVGWGDGDDDGSGGRGCGVAGRGGGGGAGAAATGMGGAAARVPRSMGAEGAAGARAPRRRGATTPAPPLTAPSDNPSASQRASTWKRSRGGGWCSLGWIRPCDQMLLGGACRARSAAMVAVGFSGRRILSSGDGRHVR
jgi:hypothetical protein